MSQKSNDCGSHVQMQLDLHVVTSKEVDGIEMGVLNDGTPFLTMRGLAEACGVNASTISRWVRSAPLKGVAQRDKKIVELLNAQGFEGVALQTKIEYQGQKVNAFPDNVCMAFLEYYAFEAGDNCNDTAKNNYRILARKSLRDYIYRMTGYDPMKQVLRSWQHFHDRLLLNPIPNGYFSVFRETADLVLASIRGGLEVDSHTVPDISVGLIWSKYWTVNNLELEYGRRRGFPHVYPDYFPQARAEEPIEAYIYPILATGRFKEWLQVEYLPQKYPSYIKRKAKEGAIAQSRVTKLLETLEPVRLNSAS